MQLISCTFTFVACVFILVLVLLNSFYLLISITISQPGTVNKLNKFRQIEERDILEPPEVVKHYVSAQDLVRNADKRSQISHSLT